MKGYEDLKKEYDKNIKKQKTTINNLSVLSAEYIIPFKMYAWLDLTEKKNKGEFVKESDLKKHKYDVFRLSQIIDSQKAIPTSGLVHESIIKFVSEIEKEKLPLDQINPSLNQEESIKALKALYNIK